MRNNDSLNRGWIRIRTKNLSPRRPHAKKSSFSRSMEDGQLVKLALLSPQHVLTSALIFATYRLVNCELNGTNSPTNRCSQLILTKHEHSSSNHAWSEKSKNPRLFPKSPFRKSHVLVPECFAVPPCVIVFNRPRPPVGSLYVAAARPPVPVPPASSLSQPQRPTNLSCDNEPFSLSTYDGTTLGVSVSTLSQAVIPEDPFFNT